MKRPNEIKPAEVMAQLARATRIIPDREMHTHHATFFKLESDCGVFTLVVGEYRPVEPYVMNEADRHDGKSAVVVLGRYVLSPIALARLKSSIAAAEKYHTAHWGALPDPAQFTQQLLTEMPPLQAPAPEPRLGFRSDN